VTALRKFCLVLVSVLLPLVARAQTDVVTTSGTVHGAVSGSVIQWLGIPYAEPPARWTRSVPKLASPTTIDATAPKPACVQLLSVVSADCADTPGQAAGTLVGSEDCLTLSVWKPAAAPSAPLPVMVWIHGGAFTSGCDKNGLTRGADLAVHGAAGGQIVVAIQYRLGPMGFFALEELASEDPSGLAGNYGMLDMVLALEWVQDNIAAFGGDPGNVTVFGESAGGVATCALLASPLTQGLFQRAVSESGNCTQAIPLRAGANSGLPPSATAIGRGETLAADPALGCGDPTTRLACMRAKTPAQILPVYNATTGALGTPPTNMAIDHYLIDEQPQALLNAGAGGGRSLLVGSNANEMTLFTLSLSVPDAAAYEALVRQQAGDYAADYLLQIWPASEFPTPLAAYRRFAEDIGFVCPSFGAAKAVNDHGAAAYAYHFVYDPGGPLQLGSFHGLELFYVFGYYTRLATLGIATDAGDAAFSDALQAAWTAYARTGTPDATPTWPPFAPAPSSPAANGSVFVWNLSNPSNVVSNSVALAGNLRDGRCAELETVGPLLNADADNRTNDVDNCPYAANSDQADSGGVAGGVADGIGNACQCGDASDDGAVDAADLTALRLALAHGAALSGAGERKCSVAGGTPDCDVLDATVLARRLAALDPPLAQDCAAANPG